MTRKLLSIALLSLYLALPSLAQESGWQTSWEEAAKLSQASGKPILMDFTGSDWCGWCMKLKAEVFDTDYFKAWAAEKVILLEVDFPQATPLSAEQQAQNDALAAKYEIQGFPTIIFANADGEKLGEAGYEEGGPESWTAKAEQSWATGD